MSSLCRGWPDSPRRTGLSVQEKHLSVNVPLNAYGHNVTPSMRLKFIKTRLFPKGMFGLSKLHLTSTQNHKSWRTGQTDNTENDFFVPNSNFERFAVAFFRRDDPSTTMHLDKKITRKYDECELQISKGYFSTCFLRETGLLIHSHIYRHVNLNICVMSPCGDVIS